MSDLEEFKARKNGEITLREIIDDLYKHQNEVEALVYVIKTKNKVIDVAFNNVSAVEVLGLLEVGKGKIFDHMWDEES